MTIDYALRIYTDLLNSNEPIILDNFRKRLNSDEYKEFIELTSFINLFKSVKAAKKFEDVFAKVNAYKEDLYSLPSASNFRTNKNVSDQEARKIIDTIFEEEFPNE